MKIKSIIIVCLFFIAGCTEQSITGRKQFIFIPDSMINSMALNEYESFLGEAKLSKDTEKTAMVERVGNNIVDAVNKYGQQLKIDTSSFNWEIKLVEDDTVNAWCMPGGKIVVYTGILKYANTEDKLAVVVGHEIAHAIAKHGSERMSQQLAVSGAAFFSEQALKEESPETQQAFMTAFALGAQFGILMPYSREHEYESDEIGLLLSTLAGYDPEAAADFWLDMSAEGGNSNIDFFSTHPATQKRIDRLKELAPKTKQKAARIKNPA